MAYSIGSVSHEVPLLGATLLWDQLLAMEKSFRNQLVSARGDLYEKILAAPSVGQKHRYECDVWVQKIAVKFFFAPGNK